MGWTEGWTEVKQYTLLRWSGGIMKRRRKINQSEEKQDG